METERDVGGSDSEDQMVQSEQLRLQQKLCDEAMELVNASVTLQKQRPNDTKEADAKIAAALSRMRQAMAIQYATAEENQASQRLNHKMARYIHMLESKQLSAGVPLDVSGEDDYIGSSGGGASGRIRSTRENILDMNNLPTWYKPVVDLIVHNNSCGDVFATLQRRYGFQEANVLNQREHLILLLTNFKEQSDQDSGDANTGAERSDQQETDMANAGIKRLHDRVFANYTKWCNYLSQSPKFTNDPLVDVVLFFLIWGEASNFRQVPEYLCFLLHHLLPQAQTGGGPDKPPGEFLETIIRPMYDEMKKDNEKMTPLGVRAPHTEIRNYDDFNEFFWHKKCLKYDPTTIAQVFGEVDPKGFPKTAKKTFMEKRSWMRALFSFRRIFLFNCALFLATIGLSLNMIMFCPNSPIMYGTDVSNKSPSRAFKVFGHEFTPDAPGTDENTDLDDAELYDPTSQQPICIKSKLVACLGIIDDKTAFTTIPLDFKALLEQVPFTNCVQQNSGRCSCYLKLLDACFEKKQGTMEYFDTTDNEYSQLTYDQSLCVPNWKESAYGIIKKSGPGKLNCDSCRLDLGYMLGNIETFTKLAKGLMGSFEDGTKREDQGFMAMLAGFACVGLIIVCELANRLFSGMGVGYVGRSLPVPCGNYCRYTCFWLLLFAVKLTFDYQFMIKTLVETSLFIWYSDPNAYLPYSTFMLHLSYNNIVYILFLWIPTLIVFMYDAQIFYAVINVIFGSFAGFNLRIGELRSFRVLRLSFMKIPRLFNRKIVPNIDDPSESRDGRNKHTKKKSDGEVKEVEMPVRRFETVSVTDGASPLTVKSQKYSNLLEADHTYSDATTDSDVASETSSRRGSNIGFGSVCGVSGAAFERIISFAMAWNQCITSLRDADVISNREKNVLSYLIDAGDAPERKIYPPAFLTAGKLDESLDIITECAILHERLSSGKKKNEKSLQKVETTMCDRLKKDELRVESIRGSYRFSSQVFLLLLGEHHDDLHECFVFCEEAVAQNTILSSTSLLNMQKARTAAAELMKALLDVPRNSDENTVKFQRSLYKVVDCVETVLACMKKILSKQEHLVKVLNESPLKENSFFFPGTNQPYGYNQLKKFVNDEAIMDIVSRAYQLLTVDNFDAEPRSEEGRRRLRFFANSLFMDMPEAKPIRKIHSLSISTPYYSEIVMYSVDDLTSQNDDSVRLLYYLQTIYPVEWINLLERVGAKNMDEALKKNPEEVQLWASYRGQTLARTVRGMMYNEDAIRFLHWLEIGENQHMHQRDCPCNKCKRLNDMVALKFNYVCTCQIYGKQRDEQHKQAQDIEYLLRKHPSLRIAYVDGPKKMKDGPPKFFSVLIRAQGNHIAEVYRIELPGNPVIGEGKPENQNHAIVFSRGEMLQCIDMNQDGYMEEMLKMPNLLSTIDRHDQVKQPLTIIGFREHVFTGAVSNLAGFMSIQELSFVSLGQRMLARNLVRQHYGHPDIFDKLFAMSTGGTAKPSKSINLSEDIFAGFNTTLRGGRVSHEEFIQVGKGRDVGMQQLALFEAKLSSGAGECVISRDAMRMATRLDFFRLHSWFYGNLGWYFTQTLTVFGIFFFIYGKVYMALSGLDEYFLSRGGLGIGGTLNTAWAFQFGFLLVVPVIAVIGVEQGFRHGISYLFWNILTLGPLFFTFQMGTRMHYFDRTLIHGGAKYRATGRGFTIKHEKFAELYRFYAFSHFYRAVELAFLLVVFGYYGTFSWCNCSWKKDEVYYQYMQPSDAEWRKRCYASYYQECVMPTQQNYGIVTFSLWFIAATWMWGPIFFNPSGLDWDKLIEDYNDWQEWLLTNNESAQSWFGWWSSELDYLDHSTCFSRLVSMVRKTRFLLLSYGLYLQVAYDAYYRSRHQTVKEINATSIILASGMLVMVLLMLCLGYIGSRLKKKMTFKQKRLRKMKYAITCVGVLLVLLSWFTIFTFANLIEITVFLLVALYWFLQVLIYKLKSNHVMVRTLARGFDRVVGWIILGPILFVAMFLPFLSAFQQRVMFNSAFTSGLEVSKLFGHNVASATNVVHKKK